VADNLPRDRSRVNLNDEWELQYWTKELGVSVDRLQKAVGRVGTSVEAVRNELTRRAMN
jgi:hypothetical protein